MAKGVKKIEWVYAIGQLYNPPTGSAPNAGLVVKPDHMIFFTIKEWFPDTKEKDKQKGAFWMKLSHDLKIVYEHTGGGTSAPKASGRRKNFGVSLDKQECGCMGFYIEASYSGYHDNKEHTGILVRGQTCRLVRSSYWRLDADNARSEINKNNPAKFGQPLHLHLELEGLHGNRCLVELFKVCKGSPDKSVGKKEAVCVLGKLDIYYSAVETDLWGSIYSDNFYREQFYITLKAHPFDKDISDTEGSQEPRHLHHAVHLHFRGKLKDYQKYSMPSSNNPVVVGAPDKNIEAHDHCRFDKLIIQEGNNYFTIFDPQDPSTFELLQFGFTFNLQTFYDTDLAEIRDRGRIILLNLIKYMQKRKGMRLKIVSHADIRHTDEYNQSLSEKRSNAVRDFLYSNGLKPTDYEIETIGMGSKEARKHTYLHISKQDSPIHQAHRRTDISFSRANQSPVVFNAICGDVLQPKSLGVHAKNLLVQNCLEVEEYRHADDKVEYVELTNQGQQRSVVKSLPVAKGKFSVQVFSDSSYAYPLFASLRPNRFELHIHSCSYFPERKYPSLVLQAFTDSLWLFRATYNYDTEYPFVYLGQAQHLPLIKGVERLYAKVMFYVENYLKGMRLLPGGILLEKASEFLLECVRSDAQLYGLAYVHRWNFNGGVYGKEKNYTAENRDLVEGTILALTFATYIVELLITVLTCGEYAAAKLPKLKRYIDAVKKGQKILKEIEELGFDIVFPKVALNIGSYYEKNKKGGVSFVTDMFLKADPLLEIKYNKTFGLVELIRNLGSLKNGDRGSSSTLNSDEMMKPLQELLMDLGTEATIDLRFSGKISCEYHLKVVASLVTSVKVDQQLHISNHLNDALSNSSGKVIGDNKIEAYAKIRAKGKIIIDKFMPLKLFNIYSFFMKPLQNSSFTISAELAAQAAGFFVYTRSYGADKANGIYYEDEIYFSGIKGEVRVMVDVIHQKKDKNPQTSNFTLFIKTYKFLLFKEFTIPLGRVNLV